MQNARAELLQAIQDEKVIAAEIYYDPTYVGYSKTAPVAYLRTNYTDKEFENFLNALDFDYDADYGWQELYGIVWLQDDAWLERYEYDGKEEWHRKAYPTIPDWLTGVMLGKVE